MKNGKALLDDSALDMVYGGTPFQTAWMNFALICKGYSKSFMSPEELKEFFAQHGWKYVISETEENYLEKDGFLYDHDYACEMIADGMFF